MKWLLALCLLTLMPAAVADVYLRVTAYGKNEAEIKENAFKQAVEQGCGVSILVNKKARNYQIDKNELYFYSGCYISKYKRVDDYTFDIWVRENKISRRILNQGEDYKMVDGLMLKDQIEFYKRQKLDNDAFLDGLLSDYPQRAYNLTQEPVFVTFDKYRNIWLNIPFRLYWSPNFIDGLFDSFILMSSLNSTASSATIKAGKKRYNYNFDDYRTMQIIEHRLKDENELRILVKLYDMNSKTFRKYCFKPFHEKGMFFYINQDQHISINADTRNIDVIKIPIDFDSGNLSEVELELLGNKDCVLEARR